MSKKIKFARFGGLSPVVQKGYTLDPNKRGYHTPPARKGFYSFIWPYYEFFLLGGNYSVLNTKYKNKNAKYEYLKDKDGNKIKYDEENPKLKKHLLQGKSGDYKRDMGYPEISWKIYEFNGYAAIKKSPKIFSYTGELWHHFNNDSIKQFEIIEEVGDWIKTDYDVFVRAFKRDNVESMLMQKKVGFEYIQINPKSPYRSIGRDELEVFIERIK